MQMRRGFWTLGLIGLLAMSAGCEQTEPAAMREQPAATTPDAAPAGDAKAADAKAGETPAGLAKPKVGAVVTPSDAKSADAKPADAKPEPSKPAVAEASGANKTVAVADAKPDPSKAADPKPLEPKPAQPDKVEGSGAAKTVDAAAAPKGFDPKMSPQSAPVPGWYQWRGPEQNGVSREKKLPETWNPDTGENVIWTADVGGMSSPVIWDNKVYTWSRVNEIAYGEGDNRTLSPGPDTQEALVCVDATNGKTLWTHTNNMTQTEVPFHRLGWSSPCVDPSTGNVYALGSQCWMLCLNGKTGEVIWQRQMTEELGMISTFGGRTQSPTIDEDQVFITGVSFGYADNAYSGHRVFALNKHTGELNWTAVTGGIPVDAPQNTPVIAVVNGQRLMIFGAGDGGIHAFQARTGKKVWSFIGSKRGFNTSVVIDGTKLYCTHGLDNFDTNALGRIFCIDMADLDETGTPKEVWKVTGIEAAFPTPIVVDKYLYVMDDRAKLYQFDKTNGKQLWKKNCGQVGKPSPVYGDGKLYVSDGDGRFWILKPEEKKAEVLSKVDLSEKLGREYVVYGSPAICDGRVYLQAATKLYCIGNKETKPEYGEIVPLPEEKPVGDKVAAVLVVPADVVLRTGESKKFSVLTFDANGRRLGEVAPDKAKWAIGKLTLPPPRKPRNVPRPELPAADGADAPAGAEAPARPVVEEKPDPTPEPAAAPVQVGNLGGTISPDGTYTAQGDAHQAGGIEATVDGVTGQARVRVLPPLPWSFDFEKAPVGKPPLTWLGAGGKFAVVQDPDNPNNKVVQKLMNLDLYYRASTNFGAEDMTGYTIASDVKANEKIIAGRRYVPSGAIYNQRYCLSLDGMKQMLQIYIWPSALPDNRNPSGSRHADIAFPWEAKKWYRLKLKVTQEKDKAIAQGKCWEVGKEEPKDWMLTLEDMIPNRTGNPGLFAVSLVGDQKSEVYFDNIVVTDNEGKPTSVTPVKADLNK